jgi:hypothetical protein
MRTELGIGQDRGHLESHLFREPAIPESPKFSLGEHKTTEQTRVLSESDVYFSLRRVKSDDMPLRGMSSHTAARYCRVICGWGSTASSTHENENPAASNFAQGVDMPRQTAKPAAACSPTQFYSV